MITDDQVDTVRFGKGRLIYSPNATVQTDDQIDALKEEKAQAKTESKEPQTQQVEIDATTQSWLDKNDWYTKDVRMASVTNAIGEDIKRSNPYITGEEFFKELDKVLEETFAAEKLGRKVKPRNPVEGAMQGSSFTKAGKQSYENLPSEAKKECDRFVRQIKGYTREQYVADYAWD